MVHDPIMTNNAQMKMEQWGAKYDEVIKAFKSSNKEPGLILGSTTGIYRSQDGWEIRAMYFKDNKDGQYKIVSCWKRRQWKK